MLANMGIRPVSKPERQRLGPEGELVELTDNVGNEESPTSSSLSEDDTTRYNTSEQSARTIQQEISLLPSY